MSLKMSLRLSYLHKYDAGMKIYHPTYRNSQVIAPNKWVELHNLILDADESKQEIQDFAIKTSRNASSLTIHELWLKAKDLNGRVGHLEKMLLEENKLLHRRIEVIEKMFMQSHSSS
jgi:hypothetical protein